MHHPGIQAIGHRERLKVASDGSREGELVYQVHRRAGHHGTAAEVLQTQYLEKEKRTAYLMFMIRGGHRGEEAPHLIASLQELGPSKGVGCVTDDCGKPCSASTSAHVQTTEESHHELSSKAVINIPFKYI